jgi:ubiquinone/menaquinone biosynthesis C-methylase UbiE
MSMQPDPEDVQSFERRSATYEDSLFHHIVFDTIHRIALGSVPHDFHPGSILDVGCGTGRLLRKAARRWPGARLIGVDPAEGMVREARRRLPAGSFRIGFAENLPLPNRSVDLAISTMSFHHWQEQAHAVNQIERVLHPGGVFVLVDIYVPGILRRSRRHGRQASPAAVQAMFSAAGLTVQAQRRILAHFLLLTVGRRE